MKKFINITGFIFLSIVYSSLVFAGTVQLPINPMSYIDNGNGTVTDNNTGLMWQQQDDGNTYNWYQASGTYDASYNPTSQDVCGELTTGSYTDWRLPAIKELISIVDNLKVSIDNHLRMTS